MNALNYQKITKDSINSYHRNNGLLMIELSSFRGSLLLALLSCRDRVERDLHFNVPFTKFEFDYLRWLLWGWLTKIFQPKLIAVQEYVTAVDASCGWENDKTGVKLFVFTPIKQPSNAWQHGQKP